MGANRNLKNSVILVTGGTGSFGHKVASRLMEHQPKEIRVFSRDETKQWVMRKQYPDFRYYLGDVRDRQSIDVAMKGVDFVFHAAALKHVPSCEEYPLEALKTNALGSENVCAAATAAGVKVVIGLSTDKAVKPINAMGICKALMEKIICNQNRHQSDTVFACVRYGNVIGSRGSVLPLFLGQIERNEALTVTDPKMTRFLMTLDDATELVFHALRTATGGETFIKKSPASEVLLLAEAVRRNYSPRGDKHPIKVVGVRPGEKVHEVLVNEYEMTRAKENKDFFEVAAEYSSAKLTAVQSGDAEYTSENTERITSIKALIELLERANPSRVKLVDAA